MNEQSEKHFGEYAIRPVHKRMPLVQKNGFAIVVVFSGTHEPEAFLLNSQTGYVIVYNTMESAERRLQSLPVPVEFDPHLKTVLVPRPEGEKYRPFTFLLKGWRTNAASR